MYRIFFKRFLDFIGAFIMLFVLSPIFIIITIGLFFANKGKPFFYQKRPGMNKQIFSILKFKTMNDKKDSRGAFLPDSERLTAIGSFIRKTSLDEIPQLLNVIKGDMSFVGPRPLLVEYLELYNEEQSERHKVRPGLTGLAQINGRNSISWEDKFEYDVKYAKNVSLSMDYHIFFSSFSKIFRAEGVNEKGQVTMTKFNGNG